MLYSYCNYHKLRGGEWMAKSTNASSIIKIKEVPKPAEQTIMRQGCIR
jgi:hypothetical protein